MSDNVFDTDVPGWLAARRYGLPTRMLAAATERRLAGDWRGACAAARFEVRFDLPGVRQQHGAEVTAQLEADLQHLAPDLVRWHLPRRWRGGSGLLEPGVALPLANYGRATLWVRTDAHLERPQRPELWFGELLRDSPDVDNWTEARYLWDVRAAPLLLRRLGGGDRTPFFHRDGRPLAEADWPTATPTDDPVALTEWVTILQDSAQFDQAWVAAGVTADFTLPDDQRWRRYQRPTGAMAATVPVLLPVVRAMLNAAPRTGTGPNPSPVNVALRTSSVWRSTVVAIAMDDAGGLTARRVMPTDAQELPTLPRAAWQRFPDLELLRAGRLAATALHPLVRTAIFPDQPDPGPYQPAIPPATGLPSVGLESIVEVAPVPVRCRGVWHRVGWRDGRTEPLDHTPEETQRERVMRSLGGEVPRCFTVTESWQGRVSGRLPRQLRDLRHHGLSVLAHGDTDELVRLLDLGIDPIGLHDRWQRGPLHHLAKVDGPTVLGRLLAAGLDVNARDGNGRTPLGSVLFDGGSAVLVRSLLDAGADPTLVDGTSGTALHLLRSRDAAIIVPWLLAAGVELESRDEYGRTPLMTQVIAAAAVEAIRSTLDAGADPTALYEYSDQTIPEMVGWAQRRDLAFLLDAHTAARAGKGTDD